MSAVPSADERYSFETDGFLVVESFLDRDHVARLRAALQRAIARRRELERRGTPHFARPGVEDPGSTRIFYLLADDPLFLELADYPPVMPYIRALLNQSQPHFHASDAFWEEGACAARAGWHIDGPDNGFRNLRPRVPMLELKIGYFLSDMTQPDQGNLMVVPARTRPTSIPRRKRSAASTPSPARPRCAARPAPASSSTMLCGIRAAPAPAPTGAASCSTTPTSTRG